jgi:3'-5' exoribonuclease
MSLIKDLKPDTKVKGVYLCKYKQLLKNKNGKDYYALKLQDFTGGVDAKIWCMHAGIGPFALEEIVEVEGEIVLFQENLQLNVHKIEKAAEGSYDLKQFIPYTPKDMEVLEKELFGFIDQVEDVFIKKLLENIFYDEEVYGLFMKGSAAKSVHHAYLGGLLEHTVSVTKIGIHLSGLYEQVKTDYVIAGCMLHDIGKITEFSPFPQNDYTDEGQLLGHIILGTQKVKEIADQIEGFPKEMSMLLQHILLAHHGEYEYGSPKRPKCIEAMIVHLADLSDSKLKMFEELLLASEGEEKYMGYHKILGRNIRRI